MTSDADVDVDADVGVAAALLWLHHILLMQIAFIVKRPTS